MFRMLKLVVILGALAGFVWFGFTVELGDKTLFGHVRAIGGSQASRDLVDGTRQKASEVTREVFQVLGVGDEAGKGDKADKKALAESSPARPPAEDLTDDDRRGMKKILEGARNASR